MKKNDGTTAAPQPVAIITSGWQDYELIDCGGFEKLERFGKHVLLRPEPQAVWPKALAEEEWLRMADAVFRRSGSGKARGQDAGMSDERGEWSLRGGMPGQWTVSYEYKQMRLRMRLGLTSFKHVGLFPEQAANWDYIYDRSLAIAAAAGRPARVLNLFAYTGGATLAARAAGAEVTHVDSVKQVVGWARENMEASGLDGVRWIVDDALKFVRREVRRGNVYDGIILDPPAYGRGPEGEKWVLDQNLGELLSLCAALLAPVNSFLILNLYSMGLSAVLARSACHRIFGAEGGSSLHPTETAEEYGELCFNDRSGISLPLGVFYRFARL